MARIKGVDIPNDKHICISLTYIYGIGRSLGRQICEAVGIDPATKTSELSQDDLIKIRDDRNARTRKGKGKVVANKKKV